MMRGTKHFAHGEVPLQVKIYCAEPPEKVAICLQCQRKCCHGMCKDISEGREQHKALIRYQYKGQTYTLMQLAKLCGIRYDTLRDRLKRGMPVNEAVNIPINAWKRLKTNKPIDYNGVHYVAIQDCFKALGITAGNVHYHMDHDHITMIEAIDLIMERKKAREEKCQKNGLTSSNAPSASQTASTDGLIAPSAAR